MLMMFQVRFILFSSLSAFLSYPRAKRRRCLSVYILLTEIERLGFADKQCNENENDTVYSLPTIKVQEM